jgi:protein ImuB
MHWIALQPALEPASAAAVLAAGDAPLADPFAAAAWWALQFTPLAAQVDGVLVLEVSASERLFGGRHALLAQLFMQNGPLALVERAQGATSLIAIGRLRCAAALPPDALPLHTLAAAQAHLPTLARLGVGTWGQLRALPRGGVVRRFGAGLVDALDRAYGQAPEVYPWLTLPDVFDAPLELAASVESAPALLFGARRLLAQLQVWLRARQHGVLALELQWELDARRSNALHVDAHHSGGALGRLVLRTAQPTQDMQHLGRLLGEQLARVTLPAPVLHMHLRTLQTQALAGESISLLPDDVRQGDRLHQLLERLSARLGPAQVLRVALQADQRPERMQCWRPAAEPLGAAAGQGSAIKSGAACAHSTRARGQKDAIFRTEDALLPTWLLATPLRLAEPHAGVPHYQGALTLLAGPQRIEAGWLEGDTHCALRDYFIARSPGAGLVWVYRERLRLQCALGQQGGLDWYLHGLFA